MERLSSQSQSPLRRYRQTGGSLSAGAPGLVSSPWTVLTVTSAREDMDTDSTSDPPVNSNLQKTSTSNDDSKRHGVK